MDILKLWCAACPFRVLGKVFPVKGLSDQYMICSVKKSGFFFEVKWLLSKLSGHRKLRVLNRDGRKGNGWFIFRCS